jgi:hypothetical protein
VVGSIDIGGRTYMISLSLVNIESGETERVEEDTCKCEIDELIESVKREKKSNRRSDDTLGFRLVLPVR